MKHLTGLTIGVMGGSHTYSESPEVLDLAEKIGKEITNHGAIVAIGSPLGFGLWAAKGAQENPQGMTICFSPATDISDHIQNFKLPVRFMDHIVYVGGGKSQKNIVMARSCHALIIGPGGVDTISECLTALQENRLVGVLRGPWDTDEVIYDLISTNPQYKDLVIFDVDPRRLLEQLIAKARSDARFTKQNLYT